MEFRRVLFRSIEHLRPGRFQPRHHFDEAAVDALAASIKAQGILQPILVRRHTDRPNEFEIVAGERRWRAAQRAKLPAVPVVIRDLSDAQRPEEHTTELQSLLRNSYADISMK